MKVSTMWFVSPLDICFTHDSISACFKPFLKDGKMQDLTVLDSVQQLMRPGEEPRELEILEVVWHKSKLFVAGTYNRRLCMYRLLAIFAPDRYGLIKVRVADRNDPTVKFFE